MENFKDLLDLLGPFIWIIVIYYLLLITFSIFWLMMLLDAAKRKYPKQGDKTRWLFIIFLLGIFGAIWYYFSVKRKPLVDNSYNKNNIQNGTGL